MAIASNDKRQYLDVWKYLMDVLDRQPADETDYAKLATGWVLRLRSTSD